LIIRKEENKDLEAIIQVTIVAFENHPISRETEHFIINALRAASALTISLVAEIIFTLIFLLWKWAFVNPFQDEKQNPTKQQE